MQSKDDSVVIVGGGLAGCECALALARFGISSIIYEQKPLHFSPAHVSSALGELVCSNSFRSDDAQTSGVGILKAEMRALGSAVMAVAEETRVPAGKALAVDREAFSARLTELVEKNPLIRLERRTISSLDAPELLACHVVIAAGPLASEPLAASLAEKIGESHCYFYDAIAPIVAADSLDMSLVFRASRYGNTPPPPYNDDVAKNPALAEEYFLRWQKEREERNARKGRASEPAASEPTTAQTAAQFSTSEPTTAQPAAHLAADAASAEMDTASAEMDTAGTAPDNTADTADNADDGDYLNCPMHQDEYQRFYQALLASEKVPSHDFEKEIHFEGCMPIEALAERGERTLVFGPLKPVGFTDPRTGRRPYAVLQLRAENADKNSYNLVGCQTKMTYGAQDAVFRLIPGLENAEFLRFGSVHRNTYVNSPHCLGSDLELNALPHIHLAGQITGVEGYVESAACGLWLGLLLAARIQNRSLLPPPPESALGSLLNHLRTPAKQFQPSNIHFGLMPALTEKPKKTNRKAVMSERASLSFSSWLKEQNLIEN